MTVSDSFLTSTSLLTFGGATTATFIVPNALQAAFDFNPKWLAFVVAQVISSAILFKASQGGASLGPTEYLVVFVNGCLVYCSATGMTSIGYDLRNKNKQRRRVPKSCNNNRVDSNELRNRRDFLSPWF